MLLLKLQLTWVSSKSPCEQQNPGSYPDSPGGLTCTLCNNHFRLPGLVDHFAPTKPKKKALLEKIGKMRPQLKRFTAAAYGDDRAVATTTNEALAEVIPAVHDCKARLVLVEAPTLTIAKQVVTQSGDQLPWCENVSLTKAGTLADLLWHDAFTPRKRKQLEDRIAQAKRFAGSKALDREVELFVTERKAQLGL